MKKLIASLILLFSFSAFAEWSDKSYFKVTRDPQGVPHGLSFESKAVVHAFDALPKIRTYQYSGTKYSNLAAGKGDGAGYEPSMHYPPHWTSSDKSTVWVEIHADNDLGLMKVELTDLDVMQQLYLNDMAKLAIESDALMAQLKLPKVAMPPLEDMKAKMLESHRNMFAVAQRTNMDYIEKEKGGVMPVSFPDITDSYITYSDYDGNYNGGNSAYFTGIIKNRYMIKIKLTDIKKIQKCSDAKNFITQYLSLLNYAALPN